MKTKSSPKTDWLARLACEKPLQIKTIEKSFADIPAGASMLIVTPKMVDEYVRSIPVGETVDQKAIRKALAKQHGAEYACPVTTGIALRVVAEAAFTKLNGGEKLSAITPFWRAVDPDSALAGKLLCGRDFLIQQRDQE